jgi:choline-sulfatase
MHFAGPDQRHGFHYRIIGDVDASLGHIPIGTTGQTKIAAEVAGPGRTAYSAYDDAVTQACCEFLREWRQMEGERPFFMVVGYVLPHCPYICPKRLFDEYYDKVDVPQLPPGYLDNLHPAMRVWRERRGVDEITHDQVRIARAAYYGLVTYMDERVGEVLQTLEESGMADNTVVIYTSDHGDMAGEHRMWWKSSFYEGSIGVPLIISWPGRFAEGKEVSAVTSLIDVGPTLLELVGAEPLPFAAGRSVLDFLTNSGSVTEYPDRASAECCSPLDGWRPAFMLRKGQWKLNYYHGYRTPQLFNLEDDPDEMCDRASDIGCADVRAELMEIVRTHWSGDMVEKAAQRNVAYTDQLRKWRANRPFTDHPRNVTQERWKAPPDCNVFPET